MKSCLLSAVLLVMFSGWAFAGDTTTEIYSKKCASCHGAAGKGDTPEGKKLKTPDLGSPEVQKKSDAELDKIIIDGKGKMPKFGGKLTPEQITDLVKFIRKFKPTVAPQLGMF